MALANRIPHIEVEVPHEPGNYFTLRIATGEELDLVMSLDENNPESTRAVARELLKSLVSWRGPLYDEAPCDEENKAQLDGKTRIWVVQEISQQSTVTLGEVQSSGPGTAMNGSEPAPAAAISPASGA